MKRTLASVLLAVLGVTGIAHAGTVERIKTSGIVRCGSVARPGLAGADARGNWSGLEVSICRAVAAALLGSPDRIAYQRYATPKEFDAVRQGRDDLFFLTGTEIHEQRLAGKLLPGPAVYLETLRVMVPAGSPAQHLNELSGKKICYLIGSPVERGLEAFFEAHRVGWLRRPFSEEGEMVDAYAAGHCDALAGEGTTLASVRRQPGVRTLSGRILPEALAEFPILSATGTDDARWGAIVAWTVHTLVSGRRTETRWYAGGAGAMPVVAPELGLASGWQDRVLKAVGSYGEIFERSVGKRSSLGIDCDSAEHAVCRGAASPFLE